MTQGDYDLHQSTCVSYHLQVDQYSTQSKRRKTELKPALLCLKFDLVASCSWWRGLVNPYTVSVIFLSDKL